MQKIYNTISLAYGARKLLLGTDDIIRSIKSRKKVIILLDSKASINTFKAIQNKAAYYGAEIIVLDDINNNLEKIFKEKKIRVMAVKDKGFRDLIKKNVRE